MRSYCVVYETIEHGSQKNVLDVPKSFNEITHTAVYAARERAARMLCDEGKRVSDCWGADS
jgi:hypothetical protein